MNNETDIKTNAGNNAAGAATPPVPPKPEEALPASASMSALKEKFGAARGARIYHDICAVGGFGDYRSGDFIGGYPVLDIKNLSADARAEVAKLLV